ncbi:hypothetical protein SK3146_01117 [Paenibacillus konkukensis]|uniref:Uncharacterized protein n=1 Tax=Paenibacillus konkukensis TaxID=2020716 RepID=A0ABY4RIL4_9BACL|nr:hypothetical protein [Paenibacillus konkukensis]UQZ81960.1 hypothetical protein SK3146_01117 [Paenibacillus konkukensis]
MEKQLTRSDYLFVLIFIFMLVLALGTFFLGVRLGQERSEAKYAELFSKQTNAAQEYSAYHQQYLVSYYHTIYQPYREFQNSWFDKLNALELNRSADVSLILKDLAKLAKDKYGEVSSASMPDSSPLLQEGQQNYAKSLKLFNEALSGFQSKANAIPAAQALDELNKDAYIVEAKKFALTAQQNYYDAIVKWNAADHPDIKLADPAKPLNVTDWRALSLNAKNDYVAAMLAASQTFRPFTPQDMTSRIDEMVATGQAGKMNLNQVQPVADVLLATDAVRAGDFIRSKSRWYAGETLPQLPFFIDEPQP